MLAACIEKRRIAPRRVAGCVWLQQPCIEELAVAAVPLSKALDDVCFAPAVRCVHALTVALKVRALQAAVPALYVSRVRFWRKLTMVRMQAAQVFLLHEDDVRSSSLLTQGITSPDGFEPWMLTSDTRHVSWLRSRLRDNSRRCVADQAEGRLFDHPRCPDAGLRRWCRSPPAMLTWGSMRIIPYLLSFSAGITRQQLCTRPGQITVWRRSYCCQNLWHTAATRQICTWCEVKLPCLHAAKHRLSLLFACLHLYAVHGEQIAHTLALRLSCAVVRCLQVMYWPWRVIRLPSI